RSRHCLTIASRSAASRGSDPMPITGRSRSDFPSLRYFIGGSSFVERGDDGLRRSPKDQIQLGRLQEIKALARILVQVPILLIARRHVRSVIRAPHQMVGSKGLE